RRPSGQASQALRSGSTTRPWRPDCFRSALGRRMGRCKLKTASSARLAYERDLRVARGDRRRAQMATIHDVAREAGVSIATVSRSLNGQARVSEQTRRRVLDIAHDLDFLPNRAARGLVTGRLGNVGVLVPDLTNPFYAPLVAGIEQVAQTLDMGVFLADSRERQLAEQTLIRRLNQQVDGLILMASRLPDEAVVSLTTALPSVLVNRAVPGISSVGVDARRGMAQILEHLA